MRVVLPETPDPNVRQIPDSRGRTVFTLRPFLLLSNSIARCCVSVPAACLGVIIIWSTTPLAIQWSGDEVGYLFGITSRMLIGVATGFVAARLLRVPLPLHRQALHTYIAAGVGLFSAMFSVYWASRYIPSGWIAVLFGMAPITTGVIAHYCLPGQPLSVARTGGMLLGTGGLALMLASAQALGPHALWGIVAMLFSVLSYSASAVAVQRIRADIHALATTIGALTITSVLLVLLYLLTDTPLPRQVPLQAGLAIGYLGVVGSVLGFALYYYILRHLEATRVALITLVTPVAALLLGQLLNHEPVQARVWLGTATILCGLVCFEYGHRVPGWTLQLRGLLARRSPLP